MNGSFIIILLDSGMRPNKISDDANTINMKLFPSHSTPAPVKSWYVPLAKIKFATIVDDTWDLSMRKILPFIDGINDVRRIAILAEVSLELTKIALEHLL